MTFDLATELESRGYRVPVDSPTGLKIELVDEHMRWQLGLG